MSAHDFTGSGHCKAHAMYCRPEPTGTLYVWTELAGVEEQHCYPATTASEQRRIIIMLLDEGAHITAFRGL